MNRKIIQFGSNLKDLFVFTPFEEEDDWGDNVEPTLLPLQFADGSFRMAGFGQSRKASKTITKRFVIYDKKLSDADRILIEKNKGAYLSKLVDYMYATLRGGVKKLYSVAEDGQIRYTYAEAISIPYSRTYTDAKLWLAFSVDFLVHDPYWYDVNDGASFYVKGLPYSNLSEPCAGLNDVTELTGEVNLTKISSSFKMTNDCSYNGFILESQDLLNYGGFCVKEDGCQLDECFYNSFGKSYTTDGLTEISLCVAGSAGASRPLVSFRGAFSNPEIINLSNNSFIKYNNVIQGNEYLIIDTSTSIGDEVQDFTIDTNIVGFDILDLEIGDSSLEFERGTNRIRFAGGLSNTSTTNIKYENKYHN